MSSRFENKLGGRDQASGLGAVMRPGVILALVLISVFSLGALLALSGFAGDLRTNSNGKAHALSDSAIGYAGVVELLRGDDMDVILSRSELPSGAGDIFHVVTFTQSYQLSKLEDIDRQTSTLIVLPKWYVTPLQERPGWVRQAPMPLGPTYGTEVLNGKLEEFSKGLKAAQVVIDDGTLTYDLRSSETVLPSGDGFSIRYLQTLEGEGFTPFMTANGKTILARVNDTSVYILSDPDVLNTMGIALKTRAKFARDLLEGLIYMDQTQPRHVSFDLSVHGFGRTKNLIKTLLTPPFLAATLCLLAAGALIAWQAFARFGDPKQEERDYQLGKYTLADNGARFIRIAGKETAMADGYSDLMRRLTAKDFYMDRESQDAIEDFIATREDKLKMTSRWKNLTSQLRASHDRDSFLNAAKAIHKWRQEITHEHK